MKDKLCKPRLLCPIFLMVWIIPVLINTPKFLEEKVEFSRGDGNERGYICYSKQLNETNSEVVVFTRIQYVTNLINDAIIFMIIVVSIFVTWVGFKRQVEDHGNRISTNEIQLLAFTLHTKAEEKKISICALSVSSFYVLCRLPLYIVANPTNEENQTAIGITTVLFVVQFCGHFLIHICISYPYRQAFLDILRSIAPCFFQCKKCKKIETPE